MLRSCAPATCQPFVKMAGMFRPMATLRPAVAKVAQPVAKTQTRNMGGGAHHDPYDVRLPPSPHSSDFCSSLHAASGSTRLVGQRHAPGCNGRGLRCHGVA